jgi:competence protein ComEA
MRGPTALLLCLAVLLGLGRQLSRRPPDWLRSDPIEHPFGLDPSASAPAGAEIEEDGPPLVSPERPLDINHASARELIALPRVGPVLAERIVALRDSLGRFERLEQLGAVKGIGDRTLEGLKPLVRFGDGS